MTEYVEHVSQHLWKENNRLFMMADMTLGGSSEQIEDELKKTEEDKLKELGHDREFYEKLVDEFSQKTDAM